MNLQEEMKQLRARILELENEIETQQKTAGIPFKRLFYRYRAYSAVPLTMRSPQIAFLHIGKAAGTSVHHLLRSALPQISIFHGDPLAFDEIAPEHLADYGLLLGHFSFCHTNKMRRPLFLITFLRDPVDRVLSSYYYLRESPAVPDGGSATMLAKQLSLREFLMDERHEIRQFTVNHQCHALVSDWRGPREEDLATLAQHAVRNLSTFGFVGFVEYFTKSVDKLCTLLNFDRGGLELHLNRTSARESRKSVDKTLVRMIEKLNAADVELYESALETFKKADG